jgi:creatinine amidohydrolase
MPREVRWERMFPDELEAALAASPVLYLPYGLCEPHGPHNALGMDALRPWAFTVAAAEQHGGIVAPPFFWHCHEMGVSASWAHQQVGQFRPWLTAYPPWMLYKSLCYHVRAADALGFHAVILLSGHAGPHSPDFPVLRDILQPHFAARLEFHLCGDFGVYGNSGHGGAAETSMLWAAFPECVDMSRLPDPLPPPPNFGLGADAREASRRAGEEKIATIAEGLHQTAQRLLAEYDRVQPTWRMVTFDDVEAIWAEEIEPRLPELSAMRDLWAGQEAPPEDSRWYPNWRVPQRWG